MCQLSPVTFHGDTIFCIDYQGQPFTPMKPIVENLGLDWATQFRKLKSNESRWGIVIMTTASRGSEAIITTTSNCGEQEMICMPVRKLPSYLNSINPRKVRPELRAKIELYQAESDDVLWNYWMHGRAERPAPQTAEAAITPDQQCTLQAVVRSKVESIPADRRPKGLYPQIWSRFNNHFRLSSYKQLPQSRISEGIAYLMAMELPAPLPELHVAHSVPAPLPSGDRPPLFRDGAFHLPSPNPRHIPGPREAALMALWKDWGHRARELERQFRELSREVDACRGDLFAHAVSDLGRHADTCFSTDSLLDGLYASQTVAEDQFKWAMTSLMCQLRLCLNVAVAQNR